MDQFEEYKSAYKKRDVDTCVESLIVIGRTYEDGFMRRMLVTDSLKNPLGFKYNQEDFEFTIEVLAKTLEAQAHASDDVVIVEQLIEMMSYTGLFYRNNKVNTELLNKNDFSQYSLSQQVRMLCIFFQDQNRLVRSKVDEERKTCGFMTGMEYDLAEVDNHKVKTISYADNFEAMLEYFEQLLRYIYYMKKKEVDLEFVDNHGDIYPYQLNEFKMLSLIANQRSLLIKLEEDIRFLNWKLSNEETETGEKFFYAFPKDKEKYRAHLIAVQRRQNHLQHRIYSAYEIFGSKNDEALRGKLVKRMTECGLENFKITKDEYEKVKEVFFTVILGQLTFMRERYMGIEIESITVFDIAYFLVFLSTISNIYIESVYKHFDQSDYGEYKNLVPVIDEQIIIELYKELHDIPSEKVRILMDIFMYHNNIDYGTADIFSRPLVRVAAGKILFCEALIHQVNLNRVVDLFLQQNNVSMAKAGYDFEDELYESLSETGILNVNRNKVEFDASDGRQVEYDFIAKFKDHLIIAEFKSVYVPYGGSEVYRRWRMIKEGVDQVNRRVDLLTSDWEEIRRLVSIELPEKVYDEDKIIKIVCSNIYDFTTLECEGVLLTDSSTLVKYFNDPYVSLKEFDGSLQDVKRKTIWSNGHPSVREFKRYLRNPVSTRFLNGCYSEVDRYMPIAEGQMKVLKFDLVLTEDPVKRLKDDVNYWKEKYYPNELCPCGSGRKFKHCCKE